MTSNSSASARSRRYSCGRTFEKSDKQTNKRSQKKKNGTTRFVGTTKQNTPSEMKWREKNEEMEAAHINSTQKILVSWALRSDDARCRLLGAQKQALSDAASLPSWPNQSFQRERLPFSEFPSENRPYWQLQSVKKIGRGQKWTRIDDLTACKSAAVPFLCPARGPSYQAPRRRFCLCNPESLASPSLQLADERCDQHSCQHSLYGHHSLSLCGRRSRATACDHHGGNVLSTRTWSRTAAGAKNGVP